MGGGPAGVGNAVNETVVFTFIALFVINVLATAVGVKATDDRDRRRVVRWLRRTAREWADGWNRIGRQTRFYGRTSRASGMPSPTTRARSSGSSRRWGWAGALAVIGGTIAIVGFLTLSTGALVAVQGYSQFSASVWKR